MDSVRPFEDWQEHDEAAPAPRPPLRVVPEGAVLPPAHSGGVALPRCPFAPGGSDRLAACPGYQAVHMPESRSYWVYQLPSFVSCAHLGTQENARGGTVTACSNPEWSGVWRR